MKKLLLAVLLFTGCASQKPIKPIPERPWVPLTDAEIGKAMNDSNVVVLTHELFRERKYSQILTTRIAEDMVEAVNED